MQTLCTCRVRASCGFSVKSTLRMSQKLSFLCVSLSLSISEGEPFYVLSPRIVMSIKKEIKYRTSHSVGNPQTLLCG